MALDLEMRIDIHPRRAPLGIDVGLEGERLECRLVHGLEDGLPTAGELLERTAVEPVQISGDGGIELGQTEEGLMAQTGQDPPFDE